MVPLRIGTGLPRRWIVLAAFALCAALSLSASGQGLPQVRMGGRPYAPHSPVFKSQSNLVGVLAVVRDDHGHAVAGLSREQFRLLVDGKPVAITGFAKETAPPVAAVVSGGAAKWAAPSTAAGARPRVVALFVDDLSLDPTALAEARAAIGKLSGEDMAGNIRLGIFTSSGLEPLPCTPDRQAWALPKLEYRARLSHHGIEPGLNVGAELAYVVQKTPSQDSPYTQLAMERMAQARLCNTPDSCQEAALAEATATVGAAEDNTIDILGALRRVIAALAAQPGERILLLTSTGFFADTLAGQVQAVADEALRDRVVIDAVDASMLVTEKPGATPFEHSVALLNRTGFAAPMATLTEDTGGTFTKNSNDLAGAMRQAVSQPEVAYLLSFAPATIPADGRFHKLTVGVAGLRHVRMQARKGYYDPAPEDDIFRAATSPAALDAAVLGPPSPNNLLPKIATAWRGGKLRIAVRLNLARLHFTDCDDARRCDDLVFTGAVFDRNGKFVTGKTGALSLALKSQRYKSMRETGVRAIMHLLLPAGAYRLREVIQQANRPGFATYDVMIHPGP
ncbi:MAG: VWA domain-containing protein [Terriglobales bacterium]